MCINCDGHHSGGSSFVYVQMIFVINEIVCAPIGTGTALRKNRSMRVPIYSIDSIAPRIWFGLANQVGPGKGCDILSQNSMLFKQEHNTCNWKFFPVF